MATDAADRDGRRAARRCCRARCGALDKVLPRDLVARQSGRHHRRRAGGALRGRAATPLADDRGVGAVLVMHAPTAIVLSDRGRRAPCAGCAPAPRRPVIGCWLGGAGMAQARPHVLHEAGIPTYDTPEDAVRGFMHIVQYRRNQALLHRRRRRRSPRDALRRPRCARGDRRQARWPRAASMLTEPEAKARAGGLRHSGGADRGRARRRRSGGARPRAIGFPVAREDPVAPTSATRSDVGGVALDLRSRAAVLRRRARRCWHGAARAAAQAQHRRLHRAADGRAAARAAS